jgi:hypothetical protein
MSTPTPRTDAEEYPEGEGQSFHVVSADFARELERELATEREKLDWVFQNCKVEANDYTTGNRDVYYVHDREDLGAAMKEDAT